MIQFNRFFKKYDNVQFVYDYDGELIYYNNGGEVEWSGFELNINYDFVITSE